MEASESHQQTLRVASTPERAAVLPQDRCDSFVVMSSITAPEYRPEKRAPIDLICVIDRSGSMAGERIEMAKRTVDFVVENLQREDRLGIVTYDDTVSYHFPLTRMTQEGKDNAKASISCIREGGSTNLCGGLVEGIDQMRARGDDKNDVASVLLFTDGQANSGWVAAADIIRATVDRAFAKRLSPPNPILMNTTPRQMTQQNQQLLWQRHQQSSQQQQQPQASGLPSLQSNGFQQMQSLTPITLTPVRQAQNPPTLGMKEEEEAETKPQEGKEAPLPCTLYTFGFGADHDASLLKKIADHGQGMYYYIDSTQAIAESYADCLGGLLSVVGQNIKVIFEARGRDVKINRVMSKFECREIMPGQMYELSLGDIQSEEQKDILCDISLSRSDPHEEELPVLRTIVRYFNVITAQQHEVSSEALLSRPISPTEGSGRNPLVDRQLNRILAAEAMDEANRAARSGDLARARDVLRMARERIGESVSREDDFCKGLVLDLERCEGGLRSHRAYTSSGCQTLTNQMQAHERQRSNSNTTWNAQATYFTTSKRWMHSNVAKVWKP